ncbi:MAG: rhodanese-like domain-containing protein [Campylobacterota bacterium]
MRFLFFLLFIISSAYGAAAFISADALDKLIQDKEIVLVDVGSKKDFEQGHIPGAVHTSITAWRKPVEKHQVMRSSEQIETAMRELGISNDSQVVIYGHNKTKEALKSSYIALAMIVHGLKEVSILDGAYEEWIDEDEQRAVSKKSPIRILGNFKAVKNPNVVVDMAYVKKRVNKVPMLEARPAVFYYGTLRSQGVKRIGHIPKAMSSFWKDKFEIDGTLKDDEVLKEIFTDGYKLNPDKEVILYCTGGLEASMNWFIVSQHLKFTKAKIYDASLREWANRDDTPLVRYKWETYGY